MHAHVGCREHQEMLFRQNKMGNMLVFKERDFVLNPAITYCILAAAHQTGVVTSRGLGLHSGAGTQS